MAVFPPRLWHGEHPSYLSTVCSGNFSKTNTQRMEGSASPYKPSPLLPPPTGSSLLPSKNRLQLSDPHNAQCWKKSQVKHTFPTVWWLAAWAAQTLKPEASVSHSEAHLEEVIGSFSCLIHRHLTTNSRTFCRLHDHTYSSCKCKVNSPLSP